MRVCVCVGGGGKRVGAPTVCTYALGSVLRVQHIVVSTRAGTEGATGYADVVAAIGAHTDAASCTGKEGGREEQVEMQQGG